ncbi:hypothetical protein HWV62_37179 [Athelia sp. TMB]|nr:hypothetical protein HWV62_37179 [Athelia sp. TMB]
MISESQPSAMTSVEVPLPLNAVWSCRASHTEIILVIIPTAEMDGSPEPEEIREATSAIFKTENISGGNVINNNGDYYENRVQIYFPQNPHEPEYSRGELSLAPPHVEQSPAHNIRFRVTITSYPEPDDMFAPHPSIPPTSQLIISPIPSASRLAFEVQALIKVVLKMKEHSVLRSSARLPETLISLQRILQLTGLAALAYQNTPLANSLSRALALDLERCQELLSELLSHHLPSWKCIVRANVLEILRKYVWWQGGQGLADELDSKLRQYRKSLASCLLAVGRAAWPELQQDTGIFAEIKELYFLLEQEFASPRHLVVDAVNDFHRVISGLCRNSKGFLFIQQERYKILKSEDDTIIDRSDIPTTLSSGMKVEMSIVLHEQAENKHLSERRVQCPRYRARRGAITTTMPGRATPTHAGDVTPISSGKPQISDHSSSQIEPSIPSEMVPKLRSPTLPVWNLEPLQIESKEEPHGSHESLLLKPILSRYAADPHLQIRDLTHLVALVKDHKPIIDP